MAITKTLGGDRLGAGKKMTVSMHGYERSTHDLSTIRRFSLSAGTLVPFLSTVALPGDTWDIDLEVQMNTQPTLGPLFGSFKVQLDLFEIPVRLYNSWLHNNKINIGMSMNNVVLPQLALSAIATETYEENQQINASSLYKYLGISGVGTAGALVEIGDEMTRQFNGIPVLAYMEIFKNYYANKQETNAYMIHTGNQVPNTIDINGDVLAKTSPGTPFTLALGDELQLNYGHAVTENGPDAKALKNITIHFTTGDPLPLTSVWTGAPTASGNILTMILDNPTMVGKIASFWTATNDNIGITLTEFPLENIDEMREALMATPGNTIYVVNSDITPYTLPPGSYTDQNGKTAYSMQSSQEGLLVKTYNSDLLNNWINTETQDFISTITGIDTSTGMFTVDSLNLAQKLYNMYNRIAVSGGTYEDWIETVYTAETMRKAETPMYMGGLIKELAFQELVSTAASDTPDGGNQPQGQLAGKGILTGKHKGGKVQIKCNEISYIMGIISLTPRIDYSQGNQWDVNLKNMDDFHKPELDEIGFQDLIIEQMHWADTQVNSDQTIVQHSAGKQPAWINYMTDINRTYSSFAEPDNEMFMTLNRQYEIDPTTGLVQDVTTYIDPRKYDQIFAEARLDSTNFWAQVGINAEVRRKMSAKLIPNL